MRPILSNRSRCTCCRGWRGKFTCKWWIWMFTWCVNWHKWYCRTWPCFLDDSVYNWMTTRTELIRVRYCPPRKHPQSWKSNYSIMTPMILKYYWRFCWRWSKKRPNNYATKKLQLKNFGSIYAIPITRKRRLKNVFQRQLIASWKFFRLPKNYCKKSCGAGFGCDR